jgi:integrase
MPRPRSGSLELRKGIFHCRITTQVQGVTRRLWFCLETSDRALAEHKRAKVLRDIETGAMSPQDIARTLGDGQTVDSYAEAYFKRREARGIVMTKDERCYYAHHVKAHVGHLPIAEVRPAQVRIVLDAAVDSGLKRASVVMIRALLHRMFKAAWRAELVETNPVDRVEVPEMREVRKQRVILTDEEFAQFMAHPGVDLELKMMSVVARTLGGMRTGDITRWDWTMLDRAQFAQAFVPRSKTGTPELLEVPELLRPVLQARWESQGRPESGPVFPVERGKRAGKQRAPRNISFARRLRRNLFRAGIVRMPPVDVPKRGQGTRTDLKREAQETMPAPNPRDPLYFETATTLPVDFHSFRRAFNTALAEAGTNIQQAMHLAGHADARTHMRYVQATPAMRRMPDGAIPRLVLPQAMAEPKRLPSKTLARPGRFELPTHSSVGRVFVGIGAKTSQSAKVKGSDFGVSDPPKAPVIRSVLPQSPQAEDALDAALARALDLATERGDLAAVRDLLAALRERKERL